MPDRKIGIEPRLQQKLILTKREKTYLELLELPTREILERYALKTFDSEYIEDTTAYSEDLHEVLDNSLIFLDLDDHQEDMARYIIYNIDSTGRLNLTAEELSEKFEISEQEAEEFIKSILTAFEEEISIYSKQETNYVVPDIYIFEDKVEVREIQVSDPTIQKAIEKRNETLLKIGQIVLELNRDFLLKKRKYPVTISVREVGRRLGFNPSTISRAIKNKNAQTPLGIFPLRFFFGRVLSPEIIKREIKELLNLKNDITDTEITKILNDTGIKIERRTVTKYRNQMTK